MKIASLISRYLLGILFLVFGLNVFLNFLHMPPMPAGPAGEFMGALFTTGYVRPIGLLEVIPAVLLLVNRYVPLALTLLAPVIVNIVLFHAFMLPSGLALAVVVVILWIVVAWSVRSAFSGILQK